MNLPRVEGKQVAGRDVKAAKTKGRVSQSKTRSCILTKTDSILNKAVFSESEMLITFPSMVTFDEQLDA